jgi:hypothetical protein
LLHRQSILVAIVGIDEGFEMYAVVFVQKSAPSMQVKGNVLLARAEIRAGDNVVCMIFSELRA